MASQGEQKRTVKIVLQVSLPENPTEDVDGLAKDLEVEYSKAVSKFPRVTLYHDPESTGTKQGSYTDEDGRERRVQPDIYGCCNGIDFVMDVKRKENSYVDSRDVNKMCRDGKVLEAVPIIAHYGDKISDDMIEEMEDRGIIYMHVDCRKPEWRAEFERNFMAHFQ